MGSNPIQARCTWYNIMWLSLWVLCGTVTLVKDIPKVSSDVQFLAEAIIWEKNEILLWIIPVCKLLSCLLVPYRRKLKGTIVLGSVRLSVRHIKILSCPDYFLTSFDILTWYLVCGYIQMSYSLSSNFVPVEWFLAELWLLNLYFLFKF